PGRDRRRRVHADRQLAGGGDPGPVAGAVGAGGERRSGGAAADAAAVAQLRPPRHRRGRRRPVRPPRRADAGKPAAALVGRVTGRGAYGVTPRRPSPTPAPPGPAPGRTASAPRPLSRR